MITELDVELRKNKERKRDYIIVDKHEKNIETIFGTVSYERTYYKNRYTGEHKYLLDELIAVTPHMRKTLNIEARLINEAADLSYFKSGSKILEKTKFSDTSVMNSIRNIGKTIEPWLAYVHEGYKKISKTSKRNKIINARYFGGVYRNSNKFWTEVLDYIYEAYDYESIEKIYLSGDAALWKRNGIKIINKSEYVLDRFHLMKYVKKMTAHLDNSYEKEFWKLLRKGKEKEIKILIKAIKEASRYILKYYSSARKYYNSDYVGCSAEGHISHIYSARLSSRPLGWVKTGADLMARIRVYMANDGNIYKYVNENFKKVVKEEKYKKMLKSLKKKTKQKIADINVQIPVIKTGIRNSTYIAINAYR